MIGKSNQRVKTITFCFIFLLFASHHLLTAQEKAGPKKDPQEPGTGTSSKREGTNKETEKTQKENSSHKKILVKNKNYEISFAAGTGIMQGHTTYQIGGSYDSPEESGELHFPLSELVFPLNTYMVSAETNILFLEKWKIDMKFQTNLKNDTDHMKDSDWGIPYEDPPGSDNFYWYGPDHLDIYSESETSLRAYILDIDLLFRFYHHVSRSPYFKDIDFFAGPGYIFQQYKFQCRLIRQWDYRPDNPEPLDYLGDGSVGLTYKVLTHIPYLKLNTEINLKNRYQIYFSIGYSPYVILNDRDNHVLRSKISKAECTGSAVLFSLGGKIDLQKSLFLKLQFDYISIDTEGEQKQYEDDVWTGTLDQKNFSERTSAGLSIGYSF